MANVGLIKRLAFEALMMTVCCSQLLRVCYYIDINRSVGVSIEKNWWWKWLFKPAWRKYVCQNILDMYALANSKTVVAHQTSTIRN